MYLSPRVTPVESISCASVTESRFTVIRHQAPDAGQKQVRWYSKTYELGRAASQARRCAAISRWQAGTSLGRGGPHPIGQVQQIGRTGEFDGDEGLVERMRDRG